LAKIFPAERIMERALQPNFIVGVGGSAGGLPAYVALMDALPSNTGMAFVIVSHLVPSASSQLAAILSRRTKMPVMVASTTMPIRANHVYVIPPNADLLIENHTFKVVSPRTMIKSHHKQVDLFFISLADAMGARAIGIIFSGADGDGTEGCRHIKAKGGTTFAQDFSAQMPDMPLSAQASGCVDFVLPPNEMPNKLLEIAKQFDQRLPAKTSASGMAPDRRHSGPDRPAEKETN
jgi:chemotaxis response regulator CheB